MEFFGTLFKVLAGLIGLPLFLGGFGGFWYGIFVAFAEDDVGKGVMISVGSVVALTVGTILGKYARGDYD